MPTFRLVSRFNWLWDICLSVAMFWGLWSLAHPALVLPECYVQAPVQRVLYAAVSPYRLPQPLRWAVQAAYLACAVAPMSVSRRPTTFTTARSLGQSPPVLRYPRQDGSLMAQHSRRSIRPCPLFSVVA